MYTDERVRCVRCSTAEYEALTTKEENVLYFVNETGSFDPTSMDTNGVIYLGDKLLNTDELKGQGYGTCSTSSGTLMDVVLSGYELHDNCFVAVRFANAVPANATMRINSDDASDAKAIRNNGSAIAAGVIKAGRKALFFYDGTYYNLISSENDGDFVPRVASTDNAVVRFDGTNGSVQNSGVTINDSNQVTAARFVTNGGTSSQFVKGNGALDGGTYWKNGTGKINTNTTIDQEPRYASVNGGKGTLEFIAGLKVRDAVGDYFYCADRRSTYVVTSNYKNKSLVIGEYTGADVSSLFTKDLADTLWLKVDNLETTPWVLTIQRTGTPSQNNSITATDVLNLLFWQHWGDNSGYLNSYKIEVLASLHDTPSVFEWYKVLERNNVSDRLNGLSTAIWFKDNVHGASNTYGYSYICGVRLTVSKATSERDDNTIPINSIQLLDMRTSHSPAAAIGAIDARGGRIYGDVIFDYGGLTTKHIYPSSDGGFNIGSTDKHYNNIYANKFIKKNGTSSQFLKADGSVDPNSYLTQHQTLPTYTIEKLGTAESGYASSYILKKDNVQQGPTINIPKDMVVSNGEVKTVTTANVPYQGAVVGDKYIDLTIANASSNHIYIPVKDLVDVYTAGNGIDISNSNVVSVKIDSGNARGLSVGANGVALALATTSADGAMSSSDKKKLDGIANGAEVNVQSDWGEDSESSDAHVLNRPNVRKGGASGNAATAVVVGNLSNTATGQYASAEGNSTTAKGSSSHAEGVSTVAWNVGDHAEGDSTNAIGGNGSHAEGSGSYTTIQISGSGTTYTTSPAVKVGDVIHAVIGGTDKFVYVTAVSGTTATVNSDTLGTISNAISAKARRGVALNSRGHSEGKNCNAIGAGSHAEGDGTATLSSSCHAEGTLTLASGAYSHAEGSTTTASGQAAHSEGQTTTASGQTAHAEGLSTEASGHYSHAGGYVTKAKGNASHAEGGATVAFGLYSHAEGAGSAYQNAVTMATYSCTGSNPYTTSANHSLKVGDVVRVNSSSYTFVTEISDNTHFTTNESLGNLTSATTVYHTSLRIIVVTGSGTSYTTSFAHGLKVGNVLRDGSSYYLVTAVSSTTAFTVKSTMGTLSSKQVFIERGIAHGQQSHCEGLVNTVIGAAGHVEGQENIAYSGCCHVEGLLNYGSGSGVHVEGYNNTVKGNYSHAEGFNNSTAATMVHLEGAYNQAVNAYEHAEGYYNKSNNGGTDATRTRHSIGIGSSVRKNAFEVMNNGDAYLVGVGGYDGTNATSNSSKTLQGCVTEIYDMIGDVESLLAAI